MIIIESPIVNDLVLPLQDYFCELDESNWALVQKGEHGCHMLSGFFSSIDEAHQGWKELTLEFPALSERPEIKILEDDEWKDAHKKHLKAWNYQDLHWVPVWEKDEYRVPTGAVSVLFDAGMAFGSGAHETTRLCAQRLIDYRSENRDSLNVKKVVDAGCGSGILAISAKRLGFGSCFGFDNDPEAIRVSKENAECNEIGVTLSFSGSTSSSEDDNLGGEYDNLVFETASVEQVFPLYKSDLVLANILASVLCGFSDELLRAINPNGTLVLSGILSSEVDKVKDHFCQAATDSWGKYRLDSRILGEWADLRFDRVF